MSLNNEIENLQETLEEVFSLVPTDEAITSSRAVVEKYLRNDNRVSSSITWAEFETDGKFVRGGISRVDIMSTRLVLNWRQNAVISEIVNHANSDGLKAGHLIKASGDQGYFWCVPYSPPERDAIPRLRLRTILLTENLFVDILNLFNADVGLSVSEKRMIYQVVCGMNPGDAARADTVSIETKRSQLKKACSKLYCSGQPELVRLMLGQMIHILHLCEAETSHIQLTEQFGAEVFGKFAKLSVQRLPNGRLMRYWELGPDSGRPLLLVQGVFFPFIVMNAPKQLEKRNIRLIVPVRGGYLDGQSRGQDFRQGLLMDQTLEDLIQFVRLLGIQPATVLGHATGGYYAMMMACREPELFDAVIITSINILRNRKITGTFSSRFMDGLFKLAKDGKILEEISKQFQKAVFSNERTTKIVLRRLFKGSDSDLEVLNGALGVGDVFTWYRSLYKSSEIGVACDFGLVSTCDVDVHKNVSVPMTFIHGENDPLTSTDGISEFAATNSLAKLVVLPKGGHLISASHPEALWNEIDRAMKLQ